MTVQMQVGVSSSCSLQSCSSNCHMLLLLLKGLNILKFSSCLKELKKIGYLKYFSCLSKANLDIGKYTLNKWRIQSLLCLFDLHPFSYFA